MACCLSLHSNQAGLLMGENMKTQSVPRVWNSCVLCVALMGNVSSLNITVTSRALTPASPSHIHPHSQTDHVLGPITLS